MLDSLLKYQGADWVGMIFGLLSAMYLAKEKRIGFAYGALCGAGWLFFGILVGSVASILSNIVLIGLNAHGWLRWKRKQESA